MKKCKSGYYYCNTDKKCKPIPKGYRIGYGGYLRHDKDDDDSNGKKKNGNGKGGNGNGGNGGNGNGNGSGGNGGGNGGSNGGGGGMSEGKSHKDHEPEMIRNQLKTAGRASKRIEKHSRKKDNFKAWVQSKITKASDYLDTAADYLDSKDVKEGSLHKWFKGSKSKDGKGGWVNVVTGGTCASDEPGEGTPKCVSSAKRASMTKAERLSAARRKKKADPGQQSKSGAAKPTYVSTDSPRKKKMKKEHFDWRSEMELNEAKDKKGKGSGSKDACYHKVKSRYSVWPSAYASGALVKCRKVGAANWGNSSKKEEFEPTGISFQQFSEKCWKGYEKKGMKTMFGKRYPNCVKKEQVERDEYGDPMGGPKISDKQKKKNLAKNEPDKQHTTDTSEGMAYGITRGSGKPSGQMAAFGKKKKENPYSLKNKIKMVIKSVAEKERAKAGVTKEDVEIVNEISSRTLSNYIKKGTKDIAKRASDDESHSGPKYGKKMSRMDGVMKAADKLAKKADQNEEVIVERQKTNQGHRQSEEQHRSDYGKASIRNVRATGKGGNAADPDERGAAIDARQKAHKEKRGVKTKGMSEAKVDDKKIFGVTADRNERRFGKKGAFDMRGSGPRGQDPSERAKLAAKRGEEHRARRGVKTKGVKEEVGVSTNAAMMTARKEAELRKKEQDAVVKKMKKEEITTLQDAYAKVYAPKEEPKPEIEEGKVGAAIGGGSGAAIGGTAGAAAGRAAGRAIGGAIGKATGIPLGGTVGKAVGSTAGHVAGSIAGRATGGGAGAAAGKATQQKVQGKKVKGLKKAAKGGAIGGVIGGAIGGGAGAALRAHNELEGEQLNEYGGMTKQVIRQGIKVGGKTGGRAAQGGLGGALKGGRNALKKSGRGEKIGRIAGGAIGGVAGGAAGAPLGGLGSVATGAAGAEVGERIGAKIGKSFDNKKKKKLPIAKEETTTLQDANGNDFVQVIDVISSKKVMSDWRDEINLSEDDMKGMSVKSGHKRPTKSGAGMTQKGVEAYRRRNPGSKLKTAVTTEPSKLKKGSKDSNRRKSYCARSAGQMKKFPKAAKDPNSRLRQARRRWNC